MKYLKIILFLCALVISNVANAETYYVNTPVLNLRSCEGTNCQILGKLTSGVAVEMVEDRGEWVKVQTDKGEGFVIKKSLSQSSNIQSLATSNNDNTDSLFAMGFILIILLLAWWLPTLIARKNANFYKIFWVNLLIGWIPIIWLILLIAALVGERKRDNVM